MKSSDCFLCPTNGPKPKDLFLFTVIHLKGKQQIPAFKKLELGTFVTFLLEKLLKQLFRNQNVSVINVHSTPQIDYSTHFCSSAS